MAKDRCDVCGGDIEPGYSKLFHTNDNKHMPVVLTYHHVCWSGLPATRCAWCGGIIEDYCVVVHCKSFHDKHAHLPKVIK